MSGIVNSKNYIKIKQILKIVMEMVDWEKCDWCGKPKVQRERCNCEDETHLRAQAEHYESHTGAQQRLFRKMLDEEEDE